MIERTAPPKKITILGWFLIIFGVFKATILLWLALSDVPPIMRTLLEQGFSGAIIDFPAEVHIGVGILVPIVFIGAGAGAGILQAARWARVLLLGWFTSMLVFSFLSTGSVVYTAIKIPAYLLLLYLLLNHDANAWFAGREPEPRKKTSKLRLGVKITLAVLALCVVVARYQYDTNLILEAVNKMARLQMDLERRPGYEAYYMWIYDQAETQVGYDFRKTNPTDDDIVNEQLADGREVLLDRANTIADKIRQSDIHSKTIDIEYAVTPPGLASHGSIHIVITREKLRRFDILDDPS